MFDDRDALAGLLSEIWCRSAAMAPEREGAVRRLASLVADALRHPAWGGAVVAGFNERALLESQVVDPQIGRDVCRLWADQWPRTCLSVAARNPRALLDAQCAAVARVLRALREQQPVDAAAYADVLEGEGAPPVHFRHKDDADCLLAMQQRNAAEADGGRAQARIAALMQVITARGEGVLKRATKAVIRGLRQLTDSRCLGDSGLRDAWEEVCVQVQHQESVHWHVYADTIREFASAYLNELPDREQVLLWLVTAAGDDWAHGSGEEDEQAGIPITAEDSADRIVEEVLSVAANWTNSRIRLALERSALEHD